MKAIATGSIHVTDGELRRREAANRAYMMRLDSRNLALPYSLEAGRYTEPRLPADIHGGWESPTCQLRGHFLGHWLSAAAMRYAATGDAEIKAKADALVEEVAACQAENGGRWAASIPEKYLHWIARGKAVWAPHYTIHKTFMGLLDMYQMAGNELALRVAVDFAAWFSDWSAQFTREQFDDILDVETGGMLEVWAQLYGITGDPSHRVLMERYYRGRLFDSLLEGKDPLTNMHANTTIPEILGCVRAYAVTGEEKYRRIAEAYWQCAVTERGQYATGGQTCGEIWTPKRELSARLGEKAQEHCTVYNMIRLADALLSWTKDPVYADYIERNLYNGIFAQAYWQGQFTHGAQSSTPDHGLLTYFLPMHGGAQKGWGSETNDFFCCHGTLVQANATHARYIAYQSENALYLCQYFDAVIQAELGGVPVTLTCKQDPLTGSFHMSSTSSGRQTIHENASKYPHRPAFLLQRMEVSLQVPTAFALHLRIPSWTQGRPTLAINGQAVQVAEDSGFAVIDRVWADGDQIEWRLPRGLHVDRLPDNPDTVAFCYGPIVLAGLCDEERMLYATDTEHPENLLTPDNEREWGSWKTTFRTVGQDRGIRFVPLMDVAYERYSVYFPISHKA